MFGLSFWELGLILLVALLVLGPKKLPQLAKSLGKGLRELRRASSDLRSAIEEPLEEVRKPLQDMRDDLAGTVHNIRDEIDREARQDDDDQEGVNPYEQPEVENRRKEVEQLYASSTTNTDDGETERSESSEEGAAPDADTPSPPKA